MDPFTGACNFVVPLVSVNEPEIRMDRTWSILFNIMLIASSTYGLMSKTLRHKKLAILGLALYCANGWLGLLSEITRSQIIEDADYLVFGITATAGIDLLVTEVCVMSNVEPRLAYLLLVPPALDLFMRYVVDRYWSPITAVTHILSVALLFNFAIRDSHLILIVSGCAFLFTILTDHQNYYDDLPGYNAIAVFCTAWFLEGKDFRDLGF